MSTMRLMKRSNNSDKMKRIKMERDIEIRNNNLKRKAFSFCLSLDHLEHILALLNNVVENKDPQPCTYVFDRIQAIRLAVMLQMIFINGGCVKDFERLHRCDIFFFNESFVYSLEGLDDFALPNITFDGLQPKLWFERLLNETQDEFPLQPGSFNFYNISYYTILQQILFDIPLAGYVELIDFTSVERGGEIHALEKGADYEFIHYIRKPKSEGGHVRFYGIDNCVGIVIDPTAPKRDHIRDCLNLAEFF